MTNIPDRQLLKDVYSAGRRHLSRHVPAEHIGHPAMRYLFRNDAMLENPFGLQTIAEDGVSKVACSFFNVIGNLSTEIDFQTTIYRSSLRPEPTLTRADVAIPIWRPEWARLTVSQQQAEQDKITEELHVAHHEAEHAGMPVTTPVLLEEAETVRDILQGATFYKFLGQGSLLAELRQDS